MLSAMELITKFLARQVSMANYNHLHSSSASIQKMQDIMLHVLILTKMGSTYSICTSYNHSFYKKRTLRQFLFYQPEYRVFTESINWMLKKTKRKPIHSELYQAILKKLRGSYLYAQHKTAFVFCKLTRFFRQLLKLLDL